MIEKMEFFSFLKERVREYRVLVGTIGRYLFAGGIGALTNISLLFVFTEYVGLYYLVSASLSFILACCVGFLLQKFWTFQERSIESMHTQAIGYLTISTVNFFLNTALLYFLVEKIHLWYIFAQVIASGLIAISSFLLYRYVIFLEKK